MKKHLLFLLFILLIHSTFASNDTVLTSYENHNAKKEFHSQDSLSEDNISFNKEVKHIKKTIKKPLSKEEKQWNFFMRTTLLILGTFVFLFVLFLVFRMKKK